jgi:hypothetical protein
VSSFKHHLTDLQFIEISNRWISETQVKIKSEVAASNQQAQALKTLVKSYGCLIDALVNPNLDKQVKFHERQYTSCKHRSSI